MSAIKFIQGVARKSLTKNQGSGITTIPGAMQSEAKAAEIVALLQKAGIPMNQLDDFIRSEADVLKFLNIIESASKPKVYSGQAAIDQLNKIFPKKGEVIEFPQKTSFKEQVEAMKKSGDIVDPNNLKKNDKVLQRDMFNNSSLNQPGETNIFSNKYLNDLDKKIIDSDAFGYSQKEWNNLSNSSKEKFRRQFDSNYEDAMENTKMAPIETIKTDTVTDTITYIKTLEPIKAMKAPNSIIARKGKYKDLTPEQSKKILQDTEDHIFQRDPDNLYDYDPEDMAKGGRAGYAVGNQVMPEVDARMKNTYEQNIKLNEIQRNMQDRVRKGSKTQGLEIGQLGDMYGKKTTSYPMNSPDLKPNEANLYGAATNMGLRPEQIKAVAYFNTLQKNYGDMGMMGAPMAGLGGVGPMGGGLASFTGVAPGTSPFAMEKFFKTPAEQFAHYQEGLRRSMMLNPNSGIYFNADKTYDAGDYVSPKGIYTFNDPDPNERRGMMVDGKEYASEQDAIDDMGIERYNQFMAKGGRAGYYTGGMVDVEPSLDDIGHGSDSLMARTRLMSPGAQATTSTGLNYLLAEDNDNMRVPFSAGGGGRRAFLKLLASIGGGAAAFKSGLLSLGEGGTKKAVTETVKQAAGSGGQVPPYFFKLVNKIKTLGDDVTQTKSLADRQKVTKYKDFELTEDVTTGQQTIQRMKLVDDVDAPSYYGNPLTEETYMSYKPGKGQADETMKGKKKPDEYEEGTAYLRTDREYAGEVVDEMSGISDDIFKEVGEEVPEAIRKTKADAKADGGRIGLFLGGGLTAGKGLAREMLKFMSKGSTNAKSPKELLQLYNPKQFNKLLDNPAYTGKISPKTGETADEMILNIIDQTKNDRSSMVGDLIGSARKIKKVDDDIEKYKQTIIKKMLDGGIDEDTAYSFAEKMAKEMKEAAAPQLTSSPPKVTEQGLLELENIQKNLLTKDRQLQATGGLATMLGE